MTACNQVLSTLIPTMCCRGEKKEKKVGKMGPISCLIQPRRYRIKILLRSNVFLALKKKILRPYLMVVSFVFVY